MKEKLQVEKTYWGWAIRRGRFYYAWGNWAPAGMSQKFRTEEIAKKMLDELEKDDRLDGK